MLRNLLVSLFFTGLVVGFPACGNEVATGTQPLSCNGQTQWVQPLRGDGSAQVRAIAALPDGTFAVAGHFSGRLELPGFSAEPFILTSAGGQDGFVARFNRDGYSLWATRMGGPGDDRALGLAALADGTTVVVGSFEQGAVFGPESKAVVLQPQGERDGFVAWFGLGGYLEQAQALQSPGVAEARSVATLADGQVLVGGTEWREALVLLPPNKLPILRAPRLGPLSLGTLGERAQVINKERDPELPPSRFDVNVTVPGRTFSARERLAGLPYGPEGYLPWIGQKPELLGHGRLPRPLATLTRFSRDGERLSVPVLQGASLLTSVRALADGGFVIAGQFVGELRVGGADKGKYAAPHPVCAGCTVGQRDVLLDAADEGVAKLESYGLEDLFVARFNAGGHLGWAHRIGAVDERTHGGQLAAGADGAVWVGAIVQRFPFVEGEAGDDVFGEHSRLALVRVDAAGQLGAQRTYAHAPSLALGALVTTSDGGLAMLASYHDLLNVALGKYWIPINAVGGQDVFVARLDAAGEPMWMKHATGSESQVGDALLALPDGSVVVGGAFSGTTAFGTGTDNVARTAEGSSDAFLWRLQ